MSQSDRKVPTLIALNTGRNLTNFSAGLILSLHGVWHGVVAAAPSDTQKLGLRRRVVDLLTDGGGANATRALGLFVRLLRLERSAVPLAFTAKFCPYSGHNAYDPAARMASTLQDSALGAQRHQRLYGRVIRLRCDVLNEGRLSGLNRYVGGRARSRVVAVLALALADGPFLL